MDEQKDKRPAGRVNYVWVMAGGYLLYLAFKLISGLFTGESDMVLASVAGGGVFTAVGIYLLLREWKAYQYGKAHINDPESWGEETPEGLEDGESAASPEEEAP